MIAILPQNPQSLEKSVEILKKGGLIAHAADTCYGLAADFLNVDALKKLQNVKGRDGKKPMSVMLPLSWLNKLEDYFQLYSFSRQLCKRLLPGPVTLILPKGPKVPSWYFPETASIGLRIPEDKNVQKLLEAFGGPLITTSANLSGQPLCLSAGQVEEVFRGQSEDLELILEGKGELGHQPSTVIEVHEGLLHVLRKGPVSEADIQEKLKGLTFEVIH